MKWPLLPIALVCGCTPSAEQDWESFQIKTDEQVREHEAFVDKAIRKGDLTVTREYYRPNLSADRWFKVEDQYGCKWWINSGHKFDGEQLDVLSSEEANCTDKKHAPEKEYIYRDRSGKIVDIDYFK